MTTVKYRLGEWDLSELATGPQDPDLEKLIESLQYKTTQFEVEKKRLTSRMTQQKLQKILEMLADITTLSSRVGGYASLLHAADTQSDEATSLLMRVSKLGSDVTNRLLFFSLWWERGIDTKNAKRLISGAGDLAEYLSHKRRAAKYTLSEPEEKIINTLDVTGASALVNIYDKITNAYRYKMRINKKTRVMTREEVSNYVRSPSPSLRKAAYRTILSKYESGKGVTGEIYQNIAQNWADECIKIRRYENPISVRNMDNNVDDKTVDTLLAVCKENAPIFQRFFDLKSKMLKLNKIRRYDLYAPIMKRSGDEERRYTYNAAVRLVLEMFERFDETLAAHASGVVDGGHVDSSTRRGKRDGAFCSTIAPGIKPYVLLNFTGRIRDVFTLAHELGHAVHSQAAADKSILVQHAPLPLAETASTFSELLLYDHLEGNMSDNERKITLAEKIDDLYATIMRQAFFTLFEIDAHSMIANGSTIDEISQTYLNNLTGQFGLAVDVSDDFAIEWSCIPHFYHSPFYCYAYSFGHLLSLSLFQRYKKEGRDFIPTYVDILSAGGSQKPETLLAGHGINIGSRGFWQDGFDYIQEQIKSLVKL